MQNKSDQDLYYKLEQNMNRMNSKLDSQMRGSELDILESMEKKERNDYDETDESEEKDVIND